jgi:hypothetical protein
VGAPCARPVVVVADEAGAARRAGGLRAEAAFLTVVAGLRVLRLAVAVARRLGLVARRLEVAPLDATSRAICWTCLLRPSRRFNAFSTSACLAVRRTWTCSWSIAVFNVFWPSLIERSSCRRTSLGTRLSASRRAFLPTLTARSTSPDGLDRDDDRFFAAMPQPPQSMPGRSI